MSNCELRIRNSSFEIRNSKFSCDRHHAPGQLIEELPQLLAREVVPAAAGVVFDLLHVAGEGELVDVLAGELPAVGEIFDLLARVAAILPRDPAIALAQLEIAVALEPLAEDSLLRGDLADRILIVDEFEKLATQDLDRLFARDRLHGRLRLRLRLRIRRRFPHHGETLRRTHNAPAGPPSPYACSHDHVTTVIPRR